MNTLRIKRRWSGNAGAPAALKSGELAFNGVDTTLYFGFGDDGGGNATSIQAIAGAGAFLALTGAQTVAGVKTFGSSPIVPTPTAGDNSTKVATTAFVKAALDAALSTAGSGDMLKSVYDTTNNGKVDAAEVADAVPWTGVTGKPASFTPSAHTHPVSEVTGLQAALDAKAPLASPALTGTPTAPTAAGGTNSTQLATTAFVVTAINSVVAGAPGLLDTLDEIASALGDDPNFATTMTTSLAGKLSKASNLADLTDAAAARTNLGLGSMATQNAGAVNITGGTIDGVIIDGGTY